MMSQHDWSFQLHDRKIAWLVLANKRLKLVKSTSRAKFSTVYIVGEGSSVK